MSMRETLHDLSQPLTALDCCLFLGLLAASQVPEEDQLLLLRQTIEEAAGQCRRVIDQVLLLQERLALVEEATAGHGSEPR
jgi:signal transduction histidine kinase